LNTVNVLHSIDKMRILHVIWTVDPRSGGPIEGITRQVTARLSKGAGTDIVSLDRPDDPWVAVSSTRVFALGVQNRAYARLQRYIPWLRYGYTPHLVPWLRKHASDYDIVVINGLWNYSALAARRVLTRASTPYVVFTHGMLDPWFQKAYPVKHFFKQLFWLFSEGPLMNNAWSVMYTTEDERRLARDQFWPYRAVEKVVGYGTADVATASETQLLAFREAIPALGDRRFLLFLSRIHLKKGCDLLIEAFARLARDHPNVDVVIAGPDQTGWRKELIEQAERLGVAHRIHWPGMLTGDAKWGAYHACDAFVLPSHSENFGIVVAEAMASGKSVLITNKVNIWREVEACGGGLVCDDTAESVHTMLKAFLSLPASDIAAMGTRARTGFLKYFDIDSFVARQIEIFLRIIRRKNRDREALALPEDHTC
jgi:glycosyltransferase involved in cell wall biosynthesis